LQSIDQKIEPDTTEHTSNINTIEHQTNINTKP